MNTRFSLTNDQMASALQISRKTLLRMRQTGTLKPGIHFSLIGSGTVRPVLRWDPNTTQEALATRTRKVMR